MAYLLNILLAAYCRIQNAGFSAEPCAGTKNINEFFIYILNSKHDKLDLFRYNKFKLLQTFDLYLLLTFRTRYIML